VIKLIEELKANYAPDKRVALWSLNFENDSLKGETNLPEAYQELMAELEKREIIFIDAVKKLPDSALASRLKRLLRSPWLISEVNQRHSAELATQALMGTPLNVLKEDDAGFWFQTPDQYLAWVDRAGIQLMTRR